MFVAHGEWKIVVKSNCVLQWFSGCWNEEAAIDYSQEFLEKTQILARKPWAIVSFLDDWDLATPEVEIHIKEHTERLKHFGCVKHCQIYTPSVVKSIQLNNMCAKSIGSYERKSFEEVASAIAWLKLNSFEVDLTDFLAELPVKDQQDSQVFLGFMK